jgi:hypothetical protein
MGLIFYGENLDFYMKTLILLKIGTNAYDFVVFVTDKTY